MIKVVQRPRGTRDFAPEEMLKRRQVEARLRQTAELFGYREISTPIFEHTDLFTKKSGDAIVDQMYTFKDKGGREISLRPELTAPTIRFYAEQLHNLPKPVKIYYFGNCFRYERPQKGRFREFWQFGVELIEAGTPESEAEVVALAVNSIKNTGLEGFKTRIGHLGILRALLSDLGIKGDKQSLLMPVIDKKDLQGLEDMILTEFELSWDSVQDLKKLIATAIDCDDSFSKTEAFDILKQNADLQEIIDGHPNMSEHLDKFNEVIQFLRLFGINEFTVDFGVARGIDYYTDLVFELDMPELGAGKQICGGGVYSLDDVVNIKEINSIGFAIGFDRVVMALETQSYDFEPRPLDAFVIPMTEEARSKAFEVAAELRNNRIAVDIDLVRRNISKSLKYASSLQANHAIILGEDELAKNSVTIRDMASGDQQLIAIPEILAFFQKKHHTG
ncbi:MAG: histidine--tRNA ligase [Thermoplasmata archaeon]|nr:histidine--tRNA ligase [Thermoplasmata archaeon]